MTTLSWTRAGGPASHGVREDAYPTAAETAALLVQFGHGDFQLE